MAACAAISQLWRLLLSDVDKSILCVATAFWSAGLDASDMFTSLACDIFNQIAALKFRITQQFSSAPQSLLHLASDVQPEQAAATLDQFQQTPMCCLDPGWARPVRVHIAQVPDPGAALAQHVRAYLKHNRPVSVREEKLHAVQRRMAAGVNAGARCFERQAASCVLSMASDHFAARGGRDLQSADPKVKKAMQIIRKKKLGLTGRGHVWTVRCFHWLRVEG